MTHKKHIAALERLFAEKAAREDADAFFDSEEFAVLEEYGDMKGAMAENSYRGSPNGSVKIEPRNVAREFYGGEYTQREFRELAIVRALEGLGYPDEQIDEKTPELLGIFEDFDDKHIGATDS